MAATGPDGARGGLQVRASRLLRLFSDVRPGEVRTALLLTLNVFLLLTAYYLLKVAREPLILLGGGAEVKSYAAAGQALLLVVAVRGYDALARRVGRIQLIGSVLLFFVACLVTFWALGRAGVPLGIPFYLWVGIFNVTLVAQFWSFANDVYSPAQGARLFAILGIGSSLGAVVGAWLAGRLIRPLGPFWLMLVAAAVLLVCLGLFAVVHRQSGAHHAVRGEPAHPEERLGGKSGAALVFADRYLLLIAALILLLNWVNTTGEYLLDRTLLAGAQADAAAQGLSVQAYVGAFKARYFSWVNLFGVLLQAFVVSRVIRVAGVPRALRVLPAVALVGYLLMGFAPVLPLIFAVKVTENSLDYSLNNTARHSLFLITSREAKYKAKTFIDTLVQRLGDVMAAAGVYVASLLAVSTQRFALFNALLVVLWLAAALAIGRIYRLRAPPVEPSPAKPGTLPLPPPPPPQPAEA
jgi:ATP:ADP antiporter, AAA family